MAGNKKIFDLPLRTGVTSDDRLALVDSGNTTTYSVKVSDIQGGGVSSLETLTGDLILSGGTGISITDNTTDTITISATGGGGGNLVAATGTTSYKTANITDNADIQGDYSIYIGNNQNLNDGITSVSGKNLLVGNGEITTGSNNAVFGASSQDAKIADSSLAGNIVLGQGRINSVGLRGSAIIQGDQADINGGQCSVMAGGYFNNLSGDFSFLATSNAYTDVTGGKNVSISNDTACDINGSYNVGLSRTGNSTITASHAAKICGGAGGDITGDYSGTFVGETNEVLTATRSVVLGGNNNSITGGLRAFVIGGQNNTHTSNYGGVLGGQGNTSSERGYAIGGNNSNIGQDACGIGTMNFSVVNRQNSDNSGHIIAGGRFHSCNTNGAQRQTFLGGYQNKIYASSPSEGMVHIGGADNWIGGGTFASPTQVAVNHAYIANSKSSQISGGTQNAIINSTGSTLNAGTTNTTIIGCNGVAGDVSDSVYVPALILANYATYNYASDALAAAGGVPLGGIYHNAGDLKVRIT